MQKLAVILALTMLAPPLSAQDRGSEWRQDIRELRSELERVHPKFPPCGVPAPMASAFDDLGARADHMTDAQIVVALQRVLAMAGDGHTLLWPFGMKRGTLMRIPLRLWLFPDGLYVVRSPEEKISGRRVMSIGGVAAKEVIDRLAPFISHDNENQLRWAAPLYATLTDFLVAVGAAASRDAVTLALDDGSEHIIHTVPVDPHDLDVKLPAPPGIRPPDYLAHRDEKFRTRKLSNGTLYVQVNAIDDSPAMSLNAFGRQLRSEMTPRNRVILDLRLNSGGEASKANELLKSLIAFDTEGGDITVLISRMTFSAAQTLATRLDEWTGARFAGEATGSRPNHYGNERPFTLPHSGLRGTIASGLNQPVTAHDERQSIEPQIAVPLTAAEYFAGSDPVLEKVIATGGS